ncbi:MAG: CPBP family intramembrane metalloprotease, partial [Calditrichia bacterium]|nr:CPBP family intramembrane metalloprotease [Calditrichia bacterium]
TITQIMESLNLPSEIFIQILGFGGMLLIAWIFRKFIDKKPFISLGLDIKNYVGDFLKGFGWGVGIISFGFVALYFTGNIAITSIQFNFGSFIGYFVFFIIVALNEEIMVRGYMLNNLFDSMNKYIALFATAVLFGAMHMMNPGASLMSFINILLAGLILGIYYVHKQNLWFPIGMHLSWNFFQGPVWGFEVSGTNTTGILTLERLGHDLVTGGEFGFEASILATIIIAASTIAIHFQYKKQSVK